jgi:hypothetical protein
MNRPENLEEFMTTDNAAKELTLWVENALGFTGKS